MKRNLSIELERRYGPESGEKKKENHELLVSPGFGLAMGFSLLAFGCYCLSVGISRSMMSDVQGVRDIVFSYAVLVMGAFVLEARNTTPRFRWVHAFLLGSMIPVLVVFLLAFWRSHY